MDRNAKNNTFLECLVKILLYIWQLPQNLLGLAYLMLNSGCKPIFNQRRANFYILPESRSSVSLGMYVFISKYDSITEAVYDHEYGHCIQSQILGPLYLIIIGIPSGLHALLYNPAGNYYSFYTESWANKLGGISGYEGQIKYHKPGIIYTTYEYLLEKYYELWK